MKIIFIILPLILLAVGITWACFSAKDLKGQKEVEAQVTEHIRGKKTVTYIKKPKLIQLIASSILALVSFFVLVLVPGSYHQVEAGQVAVVKVWGEAKEVRTPGMHFDFWLSHKYEIYDTKVQQSTIQTQAYSSDGQTMDIELVIQFQIQQENAMKIATNYGGLEMLQSRIETVANEKMKSVLSQKSAMKIIETRATVSPDVEESIRAAITNDYYVNITSVVLTDISFSDAFEKTVEDKMIAEQEKIKAEYEKEKAIIQAEQELEVAKKQAEALLEKAKKEAESELVLAQAEAEALEIMNATWNTLSAEVKEAILTQMAIDKWDGKLPETMVGDDFLKELMSYVGGSTNG